MNKIIKWFKNLKNIVDNYDTTISSINHRINGCEININDGVEIIKQRTNIHVDIKHPNDRMGSSHIIVIGKYKTMDYIQTYNLSDDDFTEIVHRVREMEKYGFVRRVDGIPSMKAVVKHECMDF